MSLQDQHDTLAAGIAAILAEQRRTNELLTGIRQALRLDDRENAKQFLKRVVGLDGRVTIAFDTAAFFEDYRSKHGSEVALPPSADEEPAEDA